MMRSACRGSWALFLGIQLALACQQKGMEIDDDDDDDDDDIGSSHAGGDTDTDTDADTEDTGTGAGSSLNGAALYSDNCASCHGSDGTGGTGPDLTAIVSTLTDDEVTTAMLEGTGDMPAPGVSEAEAAAIVSYLRDEWG